MKKTDMYLDLGRHVKASTGTLNYARKEPATGKRTYPWEKEDSNGRPTFWGAYLLILMTLQNERKWVDDTAMRYDACVCNLLCKEFMRDDDGHTVAFEDLYEEDIQERWKKTLDNIPGKAAAENCYVLLRLIMEIAHREELTKTMLWGTVSPIENADYTVTTDEEAGTHFGPPTEDMLQRQAKQLARQAVDNSICILPETEKKIYQMAESLVPEHGEYLGVLLALETGLRTSEMLALEYGDLVKMGEEDCYALRISKTSNKDSRTTKSGGKTHNMFRYAHISRHFAELLLERRDKIEKDNTGLNLDEVPVVCVGQDYTKRCIQKEANRALKYVLRVCGVAEDVMRAAAAAVRDEMAPQEETASLYLMRHQIITWAVACGCSQAMIFALAGHRMEDADVRKSDFANPDLFKSLADILRRRPLIQYLDKLPASYPLLPDMTEHADSIAIPLLTGETRSITAYATEPGVPIQIAAQGDVRVVHRQPIVLQQQIAPPSETTQSLLMHSCAVAIASGRESRDDLAANNILWLERGKSLTVETKSAAQLGAMTVPVQQKTVYEKEEDFAVGEQYVSTDAMDESSAAREAGRPAYGADRMSAPKRKSGGPSRSTGIHNNASQSISCANVNIYGDVNIHGAPHPVKEGRVRVRKRRKQAPRHERKGQSSGPKKTTIQSHLAKRGEAAAEKVPESLRQAAEPVGEPHLIDNDSSGLELMPLPHREMSLPARRENDAAEAGQNAPPAGKPAERGPQENTPASAPVAGSAKQEKYRPLQGGTVYLADDDYHLTKLPEDMLVMGKICTGGTAAVEKSTRLTGLIVHDNTQPALLVTRDCSAYYIPKDVDLMEYLTEREEMRMALCAGGKLYAYPEGQWESVTLYSRQGRSVRVNACDLPQKEDKKVSLWPSKKNGAPELAALYAQIKQADCHPLLLDSFGFALHKDGGAQDTSRGGQRRSSVAMKLQTDAELVEVLPYDAAHPETIVVTENGWSSIHTTGITAHKGGKGNKFFKPGNEDQVGFACAAHGADALLLVRSDGNVLCVPVADLSELKAVSSGSAHSGKKTMFCDQGHTIVGILPLTVK